MWMYVSLLVAFFTRWFNHSFNRRRKWWMDEGGCLIAQRKSNVAPGTRKDRPDGPENTVGVFNKWWHKRIGKRRETRVKSSLKAYSNLIFDHQQQMLPIARKDQVLWVVTLLRDILPWPNFSTEGVHMLIMNSTEKKALNRSLITSCFILSRKCLK